MYTYIDIGYDIEYMVGGIQYMICGSFQKIIGPQYTPKIVGP